MALAAEHVENVPGFLYAPGRIAGDLDSLPDRLWEWKVGESYAYIIDVLNDDRSVAFRLYYMDAISRPPLGNPPRMLTDDGVGFDAIIVAAGSYEQVDDYPTALIQATCPRLAILSHWENFWRSQAKPPYLIPFLDPEPLVRRVKSALPKDGMWVAPQPGLVMRMCGCR
jgi:hypothetical protein